MAANGSKGKVYQKNTIIQEGDIGYPAACKHGNGRDWWITIYGLTFTAQCTYLLSPSGLEGPIIQNIGSEFTDVESGSKSIFSPDGKTYVRHDGKNGLRIMDFDRCTGVFSNLRLIPYSDETYTWGAAFSADSRFLYLNVPRAVYQLDMKAFNLSNSFDTIGLWNGGYCPFFPLDNNDIRYTRRARRKDLFTKY